MKIRYLPTLFFTTPRFWGAVALSVVLSTGFNLAVCDDEAGGASDFNVKVNLDDDDAVSAPEEKSEKDVAPDVAIDVKEKVEVETKPTKSEETENNSETKKVASKDEDSAADKKEKERSLVQEVNYADWLMDLNPGKAREHYSRIIENNDELPEIPRIRAFFGRAKANFALTKYMEAFEDIEKSFPEIPRGLEVSERCELELKIGKILFSQAKKAKLAENAAKVDESAENEKNDADKKNDTLLESASRVFRAIVYNDPQGYYAAEALMLLGQCEELRGRNREAAEAFNVLVKRFPKSGVHDLAAIMAVSATLAPDKIESVSREQIEDCTRKLDAVRSSSTAKSGTGAQALKEADRRLGEARAAEMLKQARFYLKRRTKRSRESAVFVLNDIIKKYPTATAVKEAEELLVKLGRGEKGSGDDSVNE